MTDAEVACNGLEFKLDRGRRSGLIEMVRTVAQEHDGARSKDREPETFDVARARVVPELVEERIGPPAEDEGGRRVIRWLVVCCNGDRGRDRLG